MGRTSSRQASGQNDSTPNTEASVPPGYGGNSDHSFTLQAIMEMQKSIGQLSAEIKTLSIQQDKVSGKFDKLDDKLSGKMEKIDDKLSVVTHKIYAAGVVMAILLVVGGFIINKAWDMAVSHVTEIAKTAIAQPAQQKK